MPDLKCFRCGEWDGEMCACKDRQTIFHGDCRDILPLLPKCPFMLTDPPYGISYRTGMSGPRFEAATSRQRSKSIEGDEDTSLRDYAIEWHGDRPAIVFGSWKREKPKGTRHVLTWEKGDHLGMGDLSLPWKPNTEEIYILGNGFSGHRGTSVLRIQAPVSWASKGRLHQHQKPVELIVSLLKKSPWKTVLDPFAGSFTTLRACKDLGRRGIAIDIEERYCEMGAERLRQGVLL